MVRFTAGRYENKTTFIRLSPALRLKGNKERGDKADPVASYPNIVRDKLCIGPPSCLVERYNDSQQSVANGFATPLTTSSRNVEPKNECQRSAKGSSSGVRSQ